MNFYIHTFGCKVNIYESEYVTNLLIENGYKMVDNIDDADICIINTCTVTNEADKKDRKYIHMVRNNYKNVLLIVMGCYSQLNKDIVDADIVIGNRYKSKIIDLINEYNSNKKKIVKVDNISKIDFEDMYINRFISHTRAFVKIQDGCNAFCAYCAIPYARGGIRSKDFDKVIAEVTNLVNNGYKEIVLTGIHTGRYGIDKHTNLEKLLRELVKIEGIFRIRLSSIEVNEITDGIIDLIKNNDIMAKHLHIPIQSGSNSVLKNMNRLYDIDTFINKINIIRSEIDDISITTDLIVGFPGESDTDFKETIDNINKIKFTKIHTFPYSRRSGTKADKMPNQIDGNVKKCRVREILNLSDKYEEDYYKEKIGKIYTGIVEERKDKKKIVITSNYIPVEIDSDIKSNSIVKVKITNVDGLEVKGEII